MSPLLELREIHKSYGSTSVIKGISLIVDRGQVTCLIGPSGSGKSTLLRCINHLETVDSGQVLIDGVTVGYEPVHGRFKELKEKYVAAQRSSIGMVFQRFNLFPHRTAAENVAAGPMWVKRTPRDAALARAHELLDRVGLSDRASYYPGQLSGGQQQRVAIARALAMDPKLLLFDEPTSALDPELVGEVLEVMRGLAEQGMTMLIVTHEIGFARDVADDVLFIDDGMAVEHGPAREVIDNPAHERTRAFLGGALRGSDSNQRNMQME